MQGSLILEKLKDPNLRHEWQQYLSKLNKELKELSQVHLTHSDDLNEIEYLQLVLDYIEARDNERVFFWDNFVRKGTEDKAMGTTQKYNYSKYK